MKLAAIALCLLVFATGLNAKAVKIERNNADLEFTYEYPAEAAAIPALDRRFRAEAAKEYRRHLTMGREDKKTYRQQQRGSVTDFYSKVWSSAGETPRLLSLQYQHGTYTGGAHPNTDYGALLWDRKLNREVAVSSLFLRSSAFDRLTRPAYCKALNLERQKRREGEKLDLADFNACPKYADLAISPADKDKDGRFNSLTFVASHYLAGPYSEGEYAIDVPVTSQLIAAIKPEYRASFERQRQ
jgi:peptidoglycan-N-acetylmuramic acid deacetylase PdaC-like protein